MKWFFLAFLRICKLGIPNVLYGWNCHVDPGSSEVDEMDGDTAGTYLLVSALVRCLGGRDGWMDGWDLVYWF